MCSFMLLTQEEPGDKGLDYQLSFNPKQYNTADKRTVQIKILVPVMPSFFQWTVLSCKSEGPIIFIKGHSMGPQP